MLLIISSNKYFLPIAVYIATTLLAEKYDQFLNEQAHPLYKIYHYYFNQLAKNVKKRFNIEILRLLKTF